jgi:hypothetical protein
MAAKPSSLAGLVYAVKLTLRMGNYRDWSHRSCLAYNGPTSCGQFECNKPRVPLATLRHLNVQEHYAKVSRVHAHKSELIPVSHSSVLIRTASCEAGRRREAVSYVHEKAGAPCKSFLSGLLAQLRLFNRRLFVHNCPQTPSFPRTQFVARKHPRSRLKHKNMVGRQELSAPGFSLTWSANCMPQRALSCTASQPAFLAPALVPETKQQTLASRGCPSR